MSKFNQTASFKPLTEYMECALRNLKKGTPAHNIVLDIYRQLTKILNETEEQNKNEL